MIIVVVLPTLVHAAGVSGRVLKPSTEPLAQARVTLFTPNLATFLETRSDEEGKYAFTDVSPGTYRVGACALDFEYREEDLMLGAEALELDFSLPSETNLGRWTVAGDTLPEFLDATDIAILRADGKVFYCHDTEDPLLFDPATGVKSLPRGSGEAQGCMNGSLLEDGRIFFVGGQNPGEPGSFRNAVRWTKTYSPALDEWKRLPDLELEAGRWYPGLARLADGSFLVMGGGTRPSAARTATCERFDLENETWSFTGSLVNPAEFPPCALLHTGKVLATWSPPQLYDPSSGQWRVTGNFQQPNRGWPGHSDHSLIVLDDGRALAIGIRPGPDEYGVMGEIYDPVTETWSLTSNPGLLRQQTEVVQLPDGRILVAGGETSVQPAPVPTTLGIVKWCDLYDPRQDSWRRVSDMKWFREYHAVTLLVPDGRVLTTGGTVIKFQTGPTSADIEAFEPPYLFRGVRPEIRGISSSMPARGEEVVLEIFPETLLTSIVLMGAGATTHWVDAGIPRRLVLPVAQSGRLARATLPLDPNVIPLGHYLLFAMVDDIPSVALIVKVVLGDSPTSFRRADANQDGEVDVSDALSSLSYLFVQGPVPACRDAADSNDDGEVSISDPIFTLLFLFGSGVSPPPPGAAECGRDSTADLLNCAQYAPCK